MFFNRHLSKQLAELFAATGAALIALTMGLPGSAMAAWTDGQAATLVLGAADFVSIGGGALTASRFIQPGSICSDPTTGKIFVVSLNGHRVLRFSATAAVTSNSSAEAVLGQPNLTSQTANVWRK